MGNMSIGVEEDLHFRLTLLLNRDVLVLELTHDVAVCANFWAAAPKKRYIFPLYHPAPGGGGMKRGSEDSLGSPPSRAWSKSHLCCC